MFPKYMFVCTFLYVLKLNSYTHMVALTHTCTSNLSKHNRGKETEKQALNFSVNILRIILFPWWKGHTHESCHLTNGFFYSSTVKLNSFACVLLFRSFTVSLSRWFRHFSQLKLGNINRCLHITMEFSV